MAAINIEWFDEFISNVNNEIILVGEGDWSFTHSLGVLRGSWDNMQATKYTPLGKTEIPLNIQKNSEVNEIIQMPLAPRRLYRGGVDATDLTTYFNRTTKSIWFQCPWEHGGTHQLIMRFLSSAAKLQFYGYVFIGITTYEAYFSEYGLSAVISHPDYKFIGTNKTLIKTLLDKGYVHHSDSGKFIHNYLLDHHCTLIFEKKLKEKVVEEEAVYDSDDGKILNPDYHLDPIDQFVTDFEWFEDSDDEHEWLEYVNGWLECMMYHEQDNRDDYDDCYQDEDENSHNYDQYDRDDYDDYSDQG